MSEEKEMNHDQEEQVSETNEQETVDTAAVETETVERTAEDRYAELNDKYIRIHAEFDNFRKRTNKEKLDIISSANAGVLKDLLPVLDDFERAIQNNADAADIESVKEGFNLIYSKMKHAMETKGLKPMDSTGCAFDVELHEAIANVPAPNKKDVGKVIDTVEKGYLLHDKVIRFAKVVVGQ